MAKLSKEKRIKAEIDRLMAIYEDLSEVEVSSLDGLIRRAAYMRVTLEDYEADLDDKGYVEMFTQSEKTPPYERERPVARLYNSMNRNYQTIMRQLVDALPKNDAEVSEELMEFLRAK